MIGAPCRRSDERQPAWRRGTVRAISSRDEEGWRLIPLGRGTPRLSILRASPCCLRPSPPRPTTGVTVDTATPPGIRHPQPPCRSAARPGHGSAGYTDLPDRRLCLPGHRSGCLAFQYGAGGACLFAHLEPDERRARGAHRRVGWRSRRPRHGERSGGATPRSVDLGRCRIPRSRKPIALRRIA